MRTIQITHEEVETIKIALQYVYDSQLDTIKQNRKILGNDISENIIQKANKFFDAQEIFDGERDV